MAATKLGDVTLTKKTGTILTLNTQAKYVDNDVYFTIDAQSGAGAVTIASTDADVIAEANTNNISAAIGEKTSLVPSGYYLKVEASGEGTSTITSPGWLNTGSLGTATASSYVYFPVRAATFTSSDENIVTPTASITGSNVAFSNTDNGVSVTSTGGGTAAASASVIAAVAGYVPAGSQIASISSEAASQTTTASAFISGVTLTTPASGYNTFTVTVPNGYGETVTFTFTVAANGDADVSVDDDTFTGYIPANSSKF